MDKNSYLAQRLAAIGANSPEIEGLRAENARLKEQLGKAPEFKSEAQEAFEHSPQFENILNAYYMRWIREKFGAEFRQSPFVQEFQTVANKAFAEFEENHKKEVAKDAQGNKGAKRAGATDTDKAANG